MDVYFIIPYVEKGTEKQYLFEVMETASDKEEAHLIKNEMNDFNSYDGIIIKRVKLPI